jgi:hypothetical protein
MTYWMAILLITSMGLTDCSIRFSHWFPFAACEGLRQGTNHMLNAPPAFLVAPIEIIRLSAITGHYMGLILAVPFAAIRIAGLSYALAKLIHLTISLKHSPAN